MPPPVNVYPQPYGPGYFNNIKGWILGTYVYIEAPEYLDVTTTSWQDVYNGRNKAEQNVFLRTKYAQIMALQEFKDKNPDKPMLYALIAHELVGKPLPTPRESAFADIPPNWLDSFDFYRKQFASQNIDPKDWYDHFADVQYKIYTNPDDERKRDNVLYLWNQYNKAVDQYEATVNDPNAATIRDQMKAVLTSATSWSEQPIHQSFHMPEDKFLSKMTPLQKHEYVVQALHQYSDALAASGHAFWYIRSHGGSRHIFDAFTETLIRKALQTEHILAQNDIFLQDLLSSGTFRLDGTPPNPGDIQAFANEKAPLPDIGGDDQKMLPNNANSNSQVAEGPQKTLTQSMLRSEDIQAIRKNNPEIKDDTTVPTNLNYRALATNNPRMDDMLFKEGTLRPQFLVGTPKEIVPSAYQQIASDTQFDMFSEVAPGFGQGSDNKLFIENVNRDRMLVGMNPHFAPNTYKGPSCGLTPAAWQLQDVMPASKIQGALHDIQSKRNEIATILTSPPIPHTLAADRNSEPSSKALLRPVSNVLEPAISLAGRMNPVAIPAGLYLMRKDWRSLCDPVRTPMDITDDPNNGGPVLHKRRALDITVT